MDNFVQKLSDVLRHPFLPVGTDGTNFLEIIWFFLVWGAFVVLAKILQRILCRFFTHINLGEDAQQRLLLPIMLLVMFVGLILGLRVIGVDVTLIGSILTKGISIDEETHLTLAKVLSFVAVVVSSVILSKYLRLILRDQVLPPFHLPQNSRFLLLQMIHFVILGFGILMGLKVTGWKFSSLMVVLGGLSIGIGFGLQHIANNLVSGIILIFQRPIRVGDRVTVGDTFGTVRAINLLATVVTTLENVEIIVPNSQFLSKEITNWTYDSDTAIRIVLSIGVVHGSDTALTKQVLLEVAAAHAQVLDGPAGGMPQAGPPLVRFSRIGESSLDFELLVWIADVAQRFDIASDLHFMIDEIFREQSIVVAFPQRDVHLYYESQMGMPKESRSEIED